MHYFNEVFVLLIVHPGRLIISKAKFQKMSTPPAPIAFVFIPLRDHWALLCPMTLRITKYTYFIKCFRWKKGR